MELLAQTDVGGLMPILAPLGVAGILAWHLWYTTSVAFPKQVADHNDRMDKREAEWNSRFTKREAEWGERFESKDKSFTDVLTSFREELQISRVKHEEESHLFRDELCTISATNRELATDVTTLGLFISKIDFTRSDKRTSILLVEDSSTQRKIVVPTIQKFIVDTPELGGLVVDEAESYDNAITKSWQAVLVVLDVTLGETPIEKIQSFVRRYRGPVIIYSGNKFTPEEFPKAVGIVHKTDGTKALYQALVDAKHLIEV